MHFAHAADLSFEEMIIIPCHGARRALCHPRSARYFLRNVSEATLVAELTTSLAFSAKLLIFSLAASRSISSILSFILRSEEHTSELQSLMRISYAVFCLKKKKTNSKKHL